MTLPRFRPLLARRGFLSLLLLTLSPHGARAHPHVWVDVVSDVLFSKKGEMIGLRQQWTFDESYSVLAVQGLDLNRDGKYSDAELAPFMKEAFASLAKWEHFSYVKVDGRNVPFVKRENDAIAVEKGLVVLKFDLLLDKPVDSARRDVRFTVYDRSFYNLMSYAEADPIWLGENAPADCGFSIAPPKKGGRESVVIDDAYVESLGDKVNVGAAYAEWVKLDCKPQ